MRHQAAISDYYRDADNRFQQAILSMSDNDFIHTSTDELAEYHLADLCLQPILFDETRDRSIDPKRVAGVVPAHKREECYRQSGDLDFEFESVLVTLPIVSNGNTRTILDLRASTMSLGAMPEVGVHDDALHFTIDTKGYGFDFEDEKIQAEVVRSISEIKRMLEWRNADIVQQNANLKESFPRFIEERKAKLKDDNDRFASISKAISIPIKRKEQPHEKRIKLDPKPLVDRVKPKPNLPKEYALDEDKVLDVIEVLNHQGLQFEKTPKTFASLDEENFRDMLLVNLNALFEGKATGETFSNHGKTDIYLNIDEGNILVFECKIWKGKAAYHEAIDQLIGYLTCRHNFGVIITFSRNKQFSTITSSIPAIVSEHHSVTSACRKMTVSHFISSHTLTHDESKDVEIHHLFYNVNA